jgi:hypothetical protein
MGRDTFLERGGIRADDGGFAERRMGRRGWRRPDAWGHCYGQAKEVQWIKLCRFHHFNEISFVWLGG